MNRRVGASDRKIRRTVPTSVAPHELGVAAFARELLRVDDRLRGVVLGLLQRRTDSDLEGIVTDAPARTACTFVPRPWIGVEGALLAEGRLLERSGDLAVGA